MAAGETSRPEETVVAEGPWTWVIIWVGFPLVGAIAGWALESIADWVASLSWVPFQGSFKLVASIEEP